MRRPEDPGTPLTRHGPLSRRALLGGTVALGAVLVGAAGCTSTPDGGPTRSASPDPGGVDDAVREQVAASEAALIALYDATIAEHPGLASDLSAIRDEHRAHAESMQTESMQTESMQTESAQTPATTPSAASAPPSRLAALAALAEAERRAIDERTRACEAASGADVARLTALIAASEAGHVEFLRGIA